MSDWSRVILGDFWVKLGCFLTGHSYTLISGSSEASRKVVRKYMSAFVLISLIWFTVGYLLTTRYFVRDNFWFGLLSGLIAVIIVINIERTIVLGTNVSNWAKGLRVFLAVIIALIGATVIDQIIFEEDVLKYKKDHISENIESRIEQEQRVIYQNVNNLLSTKAALAEQMNKLDEEIQQNPTVVASSRTNTNFTKENGNRLNSQSSVQRIPNPAIETSNRIRNQISELDEKIGDENSKVGQLVQAKSQEYLDDRGFLQELDILVKVITASPVALVVYILWMALLLIIELLVLIIKTGDAGNDYDLLIQHQVDIKKSRIQSLR